MGNVLEAITPEIQEWIAEQQMFFVSTAPLAADGFVNCSPKGMDTFRVLGPHEVAYLDLTGSGVETIAHLRENGRIVLMFCAFAGPPKIVRFHGTGKVLTEGMSEYETLRRQFPDLPGERSIVKVQVTRVSDSCGYTVPRYDYIEQRDTLSKWAASKTRDEVIQYQREKNTTSLDGLPGIEFE